MAMEARDASGLRRDQVIPRPSEPYAPDLLPGDTYQRPPIILPERPIQIPTPPAFLTPEQEDCLACGNFPLVFSRPCDFGLRRNVEQCLSCCNHNHATDIAINNYDHACDRCNCYKLWRGLDNELQKCLLRADNRHTIGVRLSDQAGLDCRLRCLPPAPPPPPAMA